MTDWQSLKASKVAPAAPKPRKRAAPKPRKPQLSAQQIEDLLIASARFRNQYKSRKRYHEGTAMRAMCNRLKVVEELLRSM